MNALEYAYTKGKTKLSLSYLGYGGEGTIYEIVGYPDRVAKIYHDESADLRQKREAKIDAMVAISKNFSLKEKIFLRILHGLFLPFTTSMEILLDSG